MNSFTNLLQQIHAQRKDHDLLPSLEVISSYKITVPIVVCPWPPSVSRKRIWVRRAWEWCWSGLGGGGAGGRASLTGDEFCIVKECSGNELSDE